MELRFGPVDEFPSEGIIVPTRRLTRRRKIMDYCNDNDNEELIIIIGLLHRYLTSVAIVMYLNIFWNYPQ